MLETLRKQYAVDDSRIYATGFSNGANMTFLLWAARSSTFAAIAPVAGIVRDWKPATPRPVLYIAGRGDPLVTPGLQRATVESLLEIDNANGAVDACGEGCEIHRSKTSTPVRVMIHPRGHEYPPFATQAIVAFFKSHQLTLDR